MYDEHLLDDASRCRLIVDYIGTVRRIAYGMARTLPRDVSVDDLIGAGLVGLADALVKCNGRNLGQFGAYVACRVRGAMTDELRRCDPLTRPMRKFVRRKETAIRELTRGLGRSPDESETAVRLGMPLALYREQMVCASFGGVSELDPVTGAGAGGRQFLDDTIEAADDHVARTEQRERLVKALAGLPERLQRVVRLYYEQDCSLREIGKALGVTESRACQLHRDAINALRIGCRGDDEQQTHTRFTPASGWV